MLDKTTSSVLLERPARVSTLPAGPHRLSALAARLASAPSSAATCAWPL